MKTHKNDKLISGIESYEHEQRVILRVLRMCNGITSKQFDNIFGDSINVINKTTGITTHKRKRIKKLRFLFGTGNAFILGNVFNGVGYHTQWINLIQIMVQIDKVKVSIKNGNIFYETGV